MRFSSYSPNDLAVRARIADVMALYCHAVDRRRWSLMDHVFHEDATWHMSALGAAGWREACAKAAKLFDDHLAVTSHQLGNMLVRIDGYDAFTEVYCTAYHRVRADAPSGGTFGGIGCDYDLIAGLRYIDRFTLREGEWRIVERRGLSEWRHIQPAADGILGKVDPGLRGTRDATDPAAAVTAHLV